MSLDAETIEIDADCDSNVGKKADSDDDEETMSKDTEEEEDQHQQQQQQQQQHIEVRLHGELEAEKKSSTVTTTTTSNKDEEEESPKKKATRANTKVLLQSSSSLSAAAAAAAAANVVDNNINNIDSLVATIVDSSNDSKKEMNVIIKCNGITFNNNGDNVLIEEDITNDNKHQPIIAVTTTTKNRKRANSTTASTIPSATITTSFVSKIKTRTPLSTTTSSTTTQGVQQQQQQHQQQRRVLPLRVNRGVAKHYNVQQEQHQQQPQDTTTTFIVPTEDDDSNVDSKETKILVAEDGNHFLCHVCSATGDVVCCDGCPNVYHASCLPDGKSKQDICSDPWFCPDCITTTTNTVKKKKKKKKKITTTTTTTTTTLKATTTIPAPTTTYNKSLPTRNKTKSTTTTTSSTIQAITPTIIPPPITTTARRRAVATWATMAVTLPRKLVSKPTLAPSARSWKTKKEEEEDDDDASDVESNFGANKKKKKNKQQQNSSIQENTTTTKTTLNKKKRKMKTEPVEQQQQQLPQPAITERIIPDTITTKTTTILNKRPIKATPAFFFFLKENLKHLEKHLMRKDRSFKAFPLGFARNRLIARQGAKLWIKLSSEEQLRYTSDSMKDFEQRVRDWKNNSTTIPTTTQTTTTTQESSEQKQQQQQTKEEDTTNTNILIRPIMKRPRFTSSSLTVPTTTSNKKEEEGGANSILLDLLQDVRFHPIPMLITDQQRTTSNSLFADTSSNTANNNEDDIAISNNNNNNKISIPSFEVQGPISTFIGDECSGCIRGWCHFCPVLKKQFPAVEYRAKLQPPLSSLVATRIGCYYDNDDDDDPNYNVLDYPDYRSDEILQFVTHCIDLKNPNTNSPNSTNNNNTNNNNNNSNDTTTMMDNTTATTTTAPHQKLEQLSKKATTTTTESKQQENSTTSTTNADAVSVSDGGTASTAGAASSSIPSSSNATATASSVSYYECKCGTISEYKDGCLKCRRSLLANLMAKACPGQPTSTPSDEVDESSLLKLQTAMLPRLIRDQSNFEKLKEGEKAIAAVLSSSSWKPNAIMPYNNNGRRLVIPTSDRYYYNAGEEHNMNRFQSLANAAASNGGSKRDISSSSTATTSPHPSAAVPTAVIRLSHGGSHASTAATTAIAPPARRALRSRNAHNKHGRFMKGVQEDKILDRHAILLRHKDEEIAVQRKSLVVAVCGIFLGLVKRDPQRIFAEPVSASEVEYHKVVKWPMDFHIIRKKILTDNKYSFGTFISDVRLLCSNALAFNDPQSIYAVTAQRILDGLEVMQKRASDWMSTIRNTLKHSFHSADSCSNNSDNADPFAELRRLWPGSVEVMEEVHWYRSQVRADFVRTKENEAAYYGSLAIQRAAAAAAASSISSTFEKGFCFSYNPCIVRSAREDEQLRRIIDNRVAQLSVDPMLDEPSWREEAVLQLLRKVQSRRVENIASKSGCARCDGVGIGEKAKLVMAIEAKSKTSKLRGQVKPRIDESRIAHSTGLASMAAMTSKNNNIDSGTMNSNSTSHGVVEPGSSAEDFSAAARSRLVSVRGSHIHGWGLFAEQPMVAGEVVAEYIGEYVSNAVADSREKKYQELRIQDYQFRVGANLVIDATLKGGYARYINHCCDPNCVAKIIDGDYPQQHLKRVMVIARRDVEALEEITYDYQFPLENDLDARIPCNCGAKLCRGFMNWDLPEKGRKTVEIQCNSSSKRGEFGKVNSCRRDGKLKNA